MHKDTNCKRWINTSQQWDRLSISMPEYEMRAVLIYSRPTRGPASTLRTGCDFSLFSASMDSVDNVRDNLDMGQLNCMKTHGRIGIGDTRCLVPDYLDAVPIWVATDLCYTYRYRSEIRPA